MAPFDGSPGPAFPPESVRASGLLKGEALEALSVGYNVAEGIIAISAGIAAGSAALSGFGGDSLIEVTSAALIWRRLRGERLGKASPGDGERRTTRWAGALLMALSAIVLLESVRQLVTGAEPASTRIGIFLTALSLAVMPLLARQKLKLAAELRSPAMRADAQEQVACAWLSATTLAGLGLNAALGWWWADPVAAALLVPWIFREGWEAWRGEEGGERPGEEGRSRPGEEGRSRPVKNGE